MSISKALPQVQCLGLNPERPRQGYDGHPPSPVPLSETKLEIADVIAVTEKGRTFLFAESGSAGEELAVLDRRKLVGKTGKTVTF